MDRLPKIPVPLRLRWQDFRFRVAPYLIFAGMVTVAVMLWTQVNGQRTATGVGEGVRSLVASPQPGRLQVLNVRPYQLVQQGDPIAIIMPTDLRANLDLWRGELDILRLRLQPTLAEANAMRAEQNAMNYERARLELSQTKADLAIAIVNLRRAENDLKRNTPLYKEQLVSEEIYDLSLQTRDAFQAEVTEKTRAVKEIGDQLEKLSSLAHPETPRAADLVRDAEMLTMLKRLDEAHATLATNWGPIVLKAPITGMVGGLYRQQGEDVMEGEPLIQIYSLWADRVVAYLRQPYPLEPTVGLPVKITSRNRDRSVYETDIAQVGAQVEVITNALAYLKPGALVDAGLPIMMDLPVNARIRAGEMVDVFIVDQNRKPFNWREKLFPK